MAFDKNFFKNEYTKIILGIIWGLGLACIFRSACEGRKCIIYKAPNPVEIKNKIYGHKYNDEEKCYKFDTINTQCTEDAIESN